MYIDPQEFIEGVAPGLGWFYVAACALNLGAAWYVWRQAGAVAWRVVWSVVAIVFAGLAVASFAGRPLVMPEAVKSTIDGLLGPVSFSLGALLTLIVLYAGRTFFVRPEVAWSGLNASLLFLGLSMTDPQFAAIVTKADNVPIVALVYLLGLFTWLATARAVENDRRTAAGEPPVEKDYEQKVLVWPDLVYIELISMILVSVLLIVWSLSLMAPLEEPANPVVTPNPSKAPWYFLGLQELLVFSDAWNVGVVVPCLIVLGLAAIPYLDRNPQGNGYYSINQRKFAYLTFQFGFLMLWILLILVGTFMRGPNWTFFGLYEVRDPHKIVDLGNIKLSEYFWAILLGVGVPQVPGDAGMLSRFAHIVWREIAGVVLLSVYFVALPPLLGRTVLRDIRQKLGRGRYLIMVLMLLMMLTIPIKMILHWTTNLSYVVSMPEYLLNF